MASVVRPGAPAGSVHRDDPAGTQTRFAHWLRERVGVDHEVPGARGPRGLGQRGEVGDRQRGDDADPVEQPGVAPYGDTPHVVTQQLHHRVGVQAGELAGDHRDARLPRRRAGEQVGEVDAPLHDDHALDGEGPQGGGLPGLATGGEQHGDLVGCGVHPCLAMTT